MYNFNIGSEHFEEMLNKYSGNLMRSAVALAQLWRGDKGLRQLEAMLIVANKDVVEKIKSIFLRKGIISQTSLLFMTESC